MKRIFLILAAIIVLPVMAWAMPPFMFFTPAAPGPIGGTTPAAVDGTTITAHTQFTGPGTGLTGTASSLSIGGNATTATNLAGAVTLPGGTTVAAIVVPVTGSAPLTILQEKGSILKCTSAGTITFSSAAAATGANGIGQVIGTNIMKLYGGTDPVYLNGVLITTGYYVTGPGATGHVFGFWSDGTSWYFITPSTWAATVN